MMWVISGAVLVAILGLPAILVAVQGWHIAQYLAAYLVLAPLRPLAPSRLIWHDKSSISRS
jgi:hypothetical protein